MRKFILVFKGCSVEPESLRFYTKDFNQRTLFYMNMSPKPGYSSIFNDNILVYL